MNQSCSSMPIYLQHFPHKDESEVDVIDSALHGPGLLNQSSTPETGALVEVTFQKRPYQKNKYLEAEPKALGISQIMLSLFIVSIRLVTLAKDLQSQFFIGGLALFGLIAGSVAVAAQNLHLPTLKACLGVQVVMCVVSVICFMGSIWLLLTNRVFSFCFQIHTSDTNLCLKLQILFNHVIGVEMLAHAAQVALSATLAAFCCKIIQCCNPQTSVPVIAVNTPQAPQ